MTYDVDQGVSVLRAKTKRWLWLMAHGQEKVRGSWTGSPGTLTNTRTRRKEVFEPIDPANVRMYVCGPTVYDRAHLGNARPVVVFDVLFRLLRHVYGPDHVTYVRNFTDVDDKLNADGYAGRNDLAQIHVVTMTS